ncbi:MAG: type I phosphomannose isomerase catalytic subunit [Bacteroidota bacterium]
MNELYPLKFKPVFKDKIWGGNKINSVLGYNYAPLSNCGEAWLISGVAENPTVVVNGFLKDNELNELIEVYMGDLVGDEVYERFENEFPILLKLLDTTQFLSIQVHPDDALAMRRHKQHGKAEMWYIMEAEEQAEILTGFKKKIDPAEFKKIIELKRMGDEIRDLFNIEKVKQGDAFFTPTGRVHAMGPGLLLAEIQQTSDVTYRIYDWDRTDDKGLGRELHTDLAMEAIDYKVLSEYKSLYQEKTNGTVNLVHNNHFVTNLIHLEKPLVKNYTELDSFVIYLCVDGAFELLHETGPIAMRRGEAVLLPNIIRSVKLFPHSMARILEIHI